MVRRLAPQKFHLNKEMPQPCPLHLLVISLIARPQEFHRGHTIMSAISSLDKSASSTPLWTELVRPTTACSSDA